LVAQPPPPVAVESRKDEVAFARAFAADPAGEWKPLSDMDEESGHTWYHTIELPDGSTTPGMYDHRPLVPHYGLPDDLTGKRALDIGSADGFWAFELERRGAEVTSLDVTTFAETDFPRALRHIYTEHPLELPFRRGMEIARRRLDSSVKLVNQPVYDLDPDAIGTFDLVHAGDILLHLRDPALALQRIRDVTSGECLIADLFDPTLDGLGAGGGLSRFLGGWSDATWWSPALSTLTQMVADAGFDDVEVVTTYNLPPEGASEGPWRAVIRGRAGARRG
jgi:tRNA (mo5U34)-methyltransferase